MFSSLIPDGTFYRIVWGIILLGWIGTSVFSALVASRALKLIDPSLRRMQPDHCWFIFIPIWGIFWQFIVVNALALSLRDEFTRRNYIPREAKPGMASGLSASILFCFVLLPPFGILITIASFIPNIMHAYKIRNYTNELAQLIETQNNYAASQQAATEEYSEIIEQSAIHKEKDDPERFKPKLSQEEDWERWRKKE